MTLAVYARGAHNGFVNFDDDDYIFGTPQIRQRISWKFLRWAFTSFAQANWHPLTWISLALDYNLLSLKPGAVHLESAVIHALTAGLLFLLLEDLARCRWKSLLVASLYALHPLNVENVAWASERKTVLCMFFFVFALWAYGRFVQVRTPVRYFGVLAAFALALMAKPQVVTFPFVLLLWDIWPLGRLNRSGSKIHSSFRLLITEKIPLFILSAASSLITLRAQSAGGAVDLSSTLGLRAANALVSYAFYFGKTIWPAKLAVLYLFPVDGLPPWQVIGASLLLLAISVFVIVNRSRRYLLVGWLWFLGTLIPMIGLVEVGHAAQADRYACLPMIGLLLMIVWGIYDLAQEFSISSNWIVVAAGAALLALAILTFRQVGYWRDGEQLWRHEIAVGEGGFVAHDDLGLALLAKNQRDQAIQEFQAAYAAAPQDAIANLYLGVYEGRSGNDQAAVDHLITALDRISDKFPEWKEMAYAGLGTAYIDLRNYSEARRNFQAALQINPANTSSAIGMGLLADRENNYQDAIRWYFLAVQRKPAMIPALLLAHAYRENGQPQESTNALQIAQGLPGDFNTSEAVVDQMLTNIH